MEEVPYSPTDYVALFFDLFETSSDAVCITRAGDGVVLDANDAALSLFGYTRAEAIGHSMRELGLWANPNDRRRFLDAMKREGRLRGYAVRFRTKWSEVHVGTFRHPGADARGRRDPRGGGPAGQLGLSIRVGRSWTGGPSRSESFDPTRTGAAGRA